MREITHLTQCFWQGTALTNNYKALNVLEGLPIFTHGLFITHACVRALNRWWKEAVQNDPEKPNPELYMCYHEMRSCQLQICSLIDGIKSVAIASRFVKAVTGTGRFHMGWRQTWKQVYSSAVSRRQYCAFGRREYMFAQGNQEWISHMLILHLATPQGR